MIDYGERGFQKDGAGFPIFGRLRNLSKRHRKACIANTELIKGAEEMKISPLKDVFALQPSTTGIIIAFSGAISVAQSS